MGANHRGKESIFLMWEPITAGKERFVNFGVATKGSDAEMTMMEFDQMT